MPWWFLAGTVNYLCRGSHNAVAWIFDEDSGDSTPVFLVVAETGTLTHLMLSCRQGGWGCAGG